MRGSPTTPCGAVGLIKRLENEGSTTHRCRTTNKESEDIGDDLQDNYPPGIFG